jgi:hypothetical protein
MKDYYAIRVESDRFYDAEALRQLQNNEIELLSTLHRMKHILASKCPPI